MGGGKTSTSTQSVSIPPEVLARYNAVNARAEDVAKQPFQQYGGQFVAPLTETQQAGVAATSAASQSAQPYFGAATGLTMSGARDVGPLTQDQISYYQNPAMLATLAPTQAALQQQQGQQLAQQQAEAIKAGAFGGSGANMQRQLLRGQQQLAMGQAIAPIYQRAYETGLQTAQGQQGVAASDLARRMQAGQQIAGLGTGAQAAALQGAQAQIGAGTLGQQTQQADLTARYQQFLQERGYDFQVAQFLANIAMGTGALSGSTTTTTQPRGFFSNRGGFKTGETVRKAYGGGIDPNSMGGAVYEPGAFERGGYATDGRVDPTDLSAILAQMRNFQTPMGGAGPYGQAAGAPPRGPSGIVPQQQLHTPKLMTAGALPKQQQGDFATLSKGFGLADDATKGLTGKGLTERAGEKLGLRDSPEKIAEAKGEIPMAGVTGKSSGAPTPMARPDASELSSADPSFLDKAKSFLGFERGGGVMPRDHFGLGGSSVNPYENRDPSEGYIEDTLQEEEAAKKPEMLKPSGGGGGGGGGGFGDVVKVASKIIPFFLKDGGVVPRQGYQTVGRVPTNEDGGLADEEYAIRTIASEMGGKSPDEAKGIAAVIQNRLQSGKFGDNYRNVVTAKSQFEPWSNPEGQNYPMKISADSPRYQMARDAFEHIRGGGEDPTSGATHFFAPAAQKALGRSEPAWGREGGFDIGPTRFFKVGFGGKPMAYSQDEGGLGRAAGQQAIQQATSGEGRGLGAGQELGFFDRNKGIILPVLQGIGAMASSKSISPWAAALQGLGAGAKAYGEEETRQAGVEREKAGTTSTLSNIPIGNLIGSFNPATGKMEWRARPDYFAGETLTGKKEPAPSKLEQTQTEAIRTGQEAVSGKPAAATPIRPSIQDGSYIVDVVPGNIADKEFGQYGYSGSEKDSYVVPSRIGTIPSLAEKANKDQAAAQARSNTASMIPQTRLETNMLVDSVLGITPTGIAGEGPNQSGRARLVKMYNWAAKNVFGGDFITENSNVANSEIINKLTRQLGTQLAGKQGFHASGLAEALKDAQISGELTQEASVKLGSSMYVRQQIEEDFAKYYNNYVKKYGTALNVESNFAKEMGNKYEEEKKSLQRALTPVKRGDTWSSPVMDLRRNPELAPQFDEYFKKPGLARMFLGG